MKQAQANTVLRYGTRAQRRTAAVRCAKKRWRKIPKGERSATASRMVSAYWSSLTPAERSLEMRRRRARGVQRRIEAVKKAAGVVE